MEILSDTVFRGGMQAKSVTVGNVNITSDSVVVPSLYANTLLLCGGSKSISDFADITKYVYIGSGGIFVCGSKSPFLTQTFEDVIVGNKRSNSDDNYPFMFRGFNTSGYTDCSYNIYSHCGFRTSWGIQLGFTENDYAMGGGYIDLNQQRIHKWEDICVYLSAYFNNGSSCSTTEFIDKYIDECSSTCATLRLNAHLSLRGSLLSSEFRYPSAIGRLMRVDVYGGSEFLYLPGAGTYTCSGSSNPPYASDCLSSTNYTPKDNELALVGWVKNNIGSGGSSSCNTNGRVYCIFRNYIGNSVFLDSSSYNIAHIHVPYPGNPPSYLGPIEFREFASPGYFDDGDCSRIVSMEEVFGAGASITIEHCKCKQPLGVNDTEIIGLSLDTSKMPNPPTCSTIRTCQLAVIGSFSLLG